MSLFPDSIVKLYCDKKPAYQKVYLIVRASILGGHIDTTCHLTEEMIANELNVSRTPVRTALNQLKEEGILYSTDISGEKLKDLSQSDKESLLYMDELLEGAAARLAAESITPDTIGILVELCEGIKSRNPASSTRAVRDLNLQFHLLIARASHNPFLYKSIAETRDLMRQHHADWAINNEEYTMTERINEKIIRSLQNGDPDASELWMRAAIQHSKGVYLVSTVK